MMSVLTMVIIMGSVVIMTSVFRICLCIENCIRTVYKIEKFNE